MRAWRSCWAVVGDAQVDALRAKVAEASTLVERLLLAVGNREEPLRQALGNLASMDFMQKCTPLELAELTLARNLALPSSRLSKKRFQRRD